jgi:hypothetical protein
MTGHGVQWQISEIDFRKASKQFAAILDNVQNKPIHLTKKDLQEGKSVCWKIQLVPNENSPSDMRLRTLKFFVSIDLYLWRTRLNCFRRMVKKAKPELTWTISHIKATRTPLST